MSGAGWYGVRCVIRHGERDEPSYEETITIWRAASPEEAMAKAEAETAETAEILGAKALGIVQSYFIGDEETVGEGTEVFSLIRESDLDADAYLDAFFDTGREYQRKTDG
ncbi:hypothetical protein [Actinomadura parmotrematis]|uniref:DUF4288 domain-containing protein n=1 Tax=Actinomadura parmotrematis TaxID=2864039 RepID=A0ABS7FY66_9ACTN|nr:hypothetical protein [Actinomadura parmotrematis]MBW8485080.1 hypothetical protein [Actinomadura parmotrematis]